jgi:hypothetical protein
LEGGEGKSVSAVSPFRVSDEDRVVRED